MMEQRPHPSSPPPPYSESEPPKQSPKVVKFSRHPFPNGDPDLEICSHPHELLVSIDMANPDIPAVFHHWEGVPMEGPTATSSQAISTSLSYNSLQYIRGFRDLGTCWLSDAEVGDETRVHDYFTSLISNDNDGQKLAESSSDAEIISHILKHVQHTPSPPHDSPVQLFAISVLSNSGPGALFSGGPVPLWKWVKPESVYSQFTLRGVLASHWEADVGKLFANVEWTAGKDLKLLLRGVSEEKAKELRPSTERWKVLPDIW